MLHFDSLAGGTPFLVTLFKPLNIRIHNYKFFTTIFFSERNTSTTNLLYEYELKCGEEQSPLSHE